MGEERPGAMGPWEPWGVEGHGARRWVFTGAAPAPAGVGGYRAPSGMDMGLPA